MTPTADIEILLSLHWLDEVVPRVFDARSAWREDSAPFPGQRLFHNRRERLQVILSASLQDDERRWVHFSLVHRDRVPTWDELVRAKEALLGVETLAIKVVPPRSQWVNIHPNCLHLFVCLDGVPLPDFTRGSRSL